MTTEVIALLRNDTLVCVPVVDGGVLVGLATEMDLLKEMAEISGGSNDSD